MIDLKIDLHLRGLHDLQFKRNRTCKLEWCVIDCRNERKKKLKLKLCANAIHLKSNRKKRVTTNAKVQSTWNCTAGMNQNTPPTYTINRFSNHLLLTPSKVSFFRVFLWVFSFCSLFLSFLRFKREYILAENETSKIASLTHWL